MEYSDDEDEFEAYRRPGRASDDDAEEEGEEEGEEEDEEEGGAETANADRELEDKLLDELAAEAKRKEALRVERRNQALSLAFTLVGVLLSVSSLLYVPPPPDYPLSKFERSEIRLAALKNKTAELVDQRLQLMVRFSEAKKRMQYFIEDQLTDTLGVEREHARLLNLMKMENDEFERKLTETNDVLLALQDEITLLAENVLPEMRTLSVDVNGAKDACPFFYEGFRYTKTTKKGTWDQAQANCRSQGANLASTGLRNSTIRAAVFADFVKGDATMNGAWLGLRNLQKTSKKEGPRGLHHNAWVWLDGVFGTSIDIDWNKKEPNSDIIRSKEYCGQFIWNGKSNDIPCRKKFYGVCEIAYKYPPRKPNCPTL